MKHLTQSFVLYLSHELLNLARKTQYHAKKIRIKNAVSGSFIFFNPVKTVREGKHIIILRTGRTIHPGIQIGHGIVHLTAVTEDIVGPEYQFGLFLYRISYPIQGSDDYSTGWSLSLFCSNNKYKNSLLPQKTFPEKPPAIGHYRLFEILSFTGG